MRRSGSSTEDIQVDLAGCLLGVFAVLWMSKQDIPTDPPQDKISARLIIPVLCGRSLYWWGNENSDSIDFKLIGALPRRLDSGKINQFVDGQESKAPMSLHFSDSSRPHGWLSTYKDQEDNLVKRGDGCQDTNNNNKSAFYQASILLSDDTKILKINVENETIFDNGHRFNNETARLMYVTPPAAWRVMIDGTEHGASEWLDFDFNYLGTQNHINDGTDSIKIENCLKHSMRIKTDDMEFDLQLNMNQPFQMQGRQINCILPAGGKGILKDKNKPWLKKS